MSSIQFSKTHLLIYGLPLAVMLSAVAIALSPILEQYPAIGIGITYDLALTAPLLYLLLIWKRKISKVTVAPVFICGIVIASLVLPSENQGHLTLLKTYLLPLVEILVVGVVIFKTRKTIQKFKANKAANLDVYNVLRKTMINTVENKSLANFVTAELGTFYYALFVWIPKKLKPNQYTYYKANGAIGLLIAVMFVVFAETAVIHIIAVEKHPIIAWILSISSIYFAIQIFGQIKAMMHRPSEINGDMLTLKYGLFGDTTIPISAIEKVVVVANPVIEENKKTAKLTFLIETHNLAIYFKKKQRITKLYGMATECDILLLNIDDKHKFITSINSKLAAATAKTTS